ncbi:MAG: hypothetical protein NVSMB68_01560 [Thermoanaerobaculia bacterium]
MIFRTRIAAATATLLWAVSAIAGEVSATQKMAQDLPIYLGGSFVLENVVGNIEVTGSDELAIAVHVEKTVRASDRHALDEGLAHTFIRIGGDAQTRIVQTLVPPVPMRSGKWVSTVSYRVRVPHTVHVKVITTSATRIHVADIRGNVFVRSFDGVITLDGVTGPSIVDTANGSVVFNAPLRGLADAQLSTVNGNIEVHAPRDANFQWVGGTGRGDVRTTFPARLTFIGTGFRGAVNAPGGPTLTTRTLMGNVTLLQNGTRVEAARSLRAVTGRDVMSSSAVRTRLGSDVPSMHQESVQGTLAFSTIIGNVTVGVVRGNARVTTGAGEVQLGMVYGECNVTSLGGPLTLGDILGGLAARTEAGDVLVQAARNGGTITTGGGTIRLLYTGGPTKLISGGGDIVVRQAAGPINAETQSGDITITVDPTAKTEAITAKTARGNVIVNITPALAADIDATVVTSDPAVNNIMLDFPGLQLRREEIGGKTKIRATGKLNGGGDRIELYAEDGGIQIVSRASNPITVLTP